jgi:hypothetical protein
MTATHLTATPATTLWGSLPSESDVPVLTVGPGEQVTIDTISHEGILEDQGRDPVAFFGRHGVAAAEVLADAIDIAANASPRREPRPAGTAQVVDLVKGVHARIRRTDFPDSGGWPWCPRTA